MVFFDRAEMLGLIARWLFAWGRQWCNSKRGELRSAMAGRQGTTSAGAGAVKLRFCPESNDLLYPKEDKENKRLVYFCKTCNYMEPADDPCISRNLVEHTQMEKTVIKADVRADPSLPRTREQLCPKCENREAVFFCTATNEGMTLFYQCMTCGFRWQDEV